MAPETNVKPRFTGVLVVLALLVTFTGWALVRYMTNLKVRRVETRTLAPGLNYSKQIVHGPKEDTPVYTIRADTRRGWKLRLIPASQSVLERRGVSQIAEEFNTQNPGRAPYEKAPIAVNGGYFAYEGAAVGAVKVDNEWIRLPWKSRTAIGWADGGKPFIDNLSARAVVKLADGEIGVENLNGRAAASTCALLTERFSPLYSLRAGEVAAVIEKGQVSRVATSGKLSIGAGVQVLVAGASSPDKARVAALQPGDAAAFEVSAAPAKWESATTILGAGPRLMRNGVIDTTQVEEEFQPDVIARGPRTMIGIDKRGGLIIQVIEAWHDKIRGFTLEAAASEIMRAGAVDAINLDGGSSTTLWVQGKTLTHASDLVDRKNQIIEPAAERREVGVANAILLEKGEEINQGQ
jgi:hypothetical protein